MKDLKIAVIGYGYWGPNLVRNFTNLENSTVSHVVDESPDRLEKVKITFSVEFAYYLLYHL